MKNIVLILIVCLMLAGCGDSKEEKKSKAEAVEQFIKECKSGASCEVKFGDWDNYLKCTCANTVWIDDKQPS